MGSWIDLHTHSTASDGTSSARDIVRKAAQIGLAAVSVTDHDTVSATGEAMAAGKDYGVQVISGVELSGKWRPTETLHILGYYFHPTDAVLEIGLKAYLAARDVRNPKIIQKLRDCGIDITYEEVRAQAKGDVVGRPHIAAVLLQKNYVRDIEDAFVKYLRRGARAYVPKDTLPPEEAVNLIRDAGGVAVLAHPKFLNLVEAQEEKFIERMAAGGLGGLEAYYSGYTQEDTRRYLALAKRYDLAASGGSDFHGLIKPEIQLGIGFGALCVPYEILEGLKAKVPAKIPLQGDAQ